MSMLMGLSRSDKQPMMVPSRLKQRALAWCKQTRQEIYCFAYDDDGDIDGPDDDSDGDDQIKRQQCEAYPRA